MSVFVCFVEWCACPAVLQGGSTAAVLILVPMMGMIIYFALAISRKEVITFKGW